MKVVTVNLPEKHVDLIDRLTGDDGMYPHRSEFIRMAVRRFLLKELQLARRLSRHSESVEGREQEQRQEQEDYGIS
jgi:Arc/MetJ-type ribon-helix-helix transcriptional regulator